MAEFKGVAEKFRLSLVDDDTGAADRVVCQLGLDGLFILTPDEKRTLRKYPLNHISRWALRGSNLFLYTKTPVDVEERTVTLQADERTMRNVLDTLTCSCMQLYEILQSNSDSAATDTTTNALSALIDGQKKKKASLPTADEVEFWLNPEKSGWLYSQGDYVKTWRRRWFVLKQGYLFRFATSDINSSSKPRGIVDLSKVSDVADGRDVTGKQNTLKLSTPTAKICYLADSETEAVEWMSALDGAVTKVVKAIAGVEDEPPLPAPKPVVQQPSRSSSTRYTAPTNDRNTMVTVLNYEAPTAPPGPMDRQQHRPSTSSYGYPSIAGIAGARAVTEPETVKVDYGGQYFSGGGYTSRLSDQQAGSTSSSDTYHPTQAYAPAQYQAAPAPLQQQPSAAYAGQPNYLDEAAQHWYAQQGSQSTAYPVQQPTAAAPHAPPPAAGEVVPWQVHYAADGRPYYFNPQTGATQWEAPPGM